MRDEGPSGPRRRFAPIKSLMLREQVVTPIRNAILFGELPVGERLTETDLAEQMSVSRVPIREALRQLEHEGLIVSVPHRGAVVAAVDDAEVEALYHLRAELEAFAIVAAMQRSDGRLATGLRATLTEMTTAAELGNQAGLAEADLEFHRQLVRASGYRILARVWSTMDGPVRARIHRLFQGPFQAELVGYTASSHAAIVGAVEAGDEAAAAAIRQHILETRDLAERGVQR